MFGILSACCVAAVAFSSFGHHNRHHHHAHRRASHERRVRWGGWHEAVASDYGTSGDGELGNTMACGGVLETSSRVVANLTLPCGTVVQVCYRGCINATVRDRGPYVAGRQFDLAYYGVAVPIGFDGVGTIRWRQQLSRRPHR